MSSWHGARPIVAALGVATLVACGEDRAPAGRAEAPAAEAEAEAEAGPIKGTPAGGLREWVAEIRAGILELPAQAESDAVGAQRRALDLYVGRQEYIEMYWGPGGRLTAGAQLGGAVEEAEARFHELMRLLGSRPAPGAAAVSGAVSRLESQLERVVREAEAAGARLLPPAGPADESGEPVGAVARVAGPERPVRNAEIAGIQGQLDSARASYVAGDREAALARVERAYLEDFEPLEPVLPARGVGRIERLIHLSLRPQIAGGAPADEVGSTFAALASEFREIDRQLDSGTTFWFGAANAFIIIAREGLEAVLLIAALLAYLAATGAESRHRRQIYAGVAGGVVASLLTWVLARTLIPIGGAQRELVEGLTALVAVCVLLYVSHWLFQRTYIHDWKRFLQRQAGEAVSKGSALAMAGLAFAAVYREGFETVLFYQALLFESGPASVAAGALPGLGLILVVGLAIVRAGLRLPLRRVFGATNAILLYLALVFLGKGIYNLQEAGLFAAAPLGWVPDHELSRQLLGVYPLAETLLAQAFLALLLAATFLYYRRRSGPALGAVSG